MFLTVNSKLYFSVNIFLVDYWFATYNFRLDVIQKNKQPQAGLFAELECTNCKLVMFGNKNTINKHLRGIISRNKPKKPPKGIHL